MPNALAPLLGYERRFYISLKSALELGTFSITGANSGTWTANVAEAAALSADPREIVCVLNGAVNSAANIVLTLAGTDANSAALTGKLATFAPPSYSNQQQNVFARGYAAEPVVTDDTKWKTISGMTIACNADVTGIDIAVLAMPSLTDFVQVAGRMEVDYTPKTDQPAVIRIGRDEGRYIKPGNIPLGRFSTQLKNLNSSEGIARFAGQRVTGLIRDFKLDRLNTVNVFLKGMILNGSERAPEADEPATVSADGLYENYAVLLAQGA